MAAVLIIVAVVVILLVVVIGAVIGMYNSLVKLNIKTDESRNIKIWAPPRAARSVEPP